MSKLLSALLAGAAALALGSAALAAEQSGDTQSRDTQTEAQPNTTPEPSDAQSQQNQSESAGNQSSQSGDQPTQADTSDVKGTAPKQGTIKGEDQSQGQASQAIPGGGASDSNSDQAAAQPDAKEQDAKEQELTAALKKCDSLSGTQKQDCIDAAMKKPGEM